MANAAMGNSSKRHAVVLSAVHNPEAAAKKGVLKSFSRKTGREGTAPPPPPSTRPFPPFPSQRKSVHIPCWWPPHPMHEGLDETDAHEMVGPQHFPLPPPLFHIYLFSCMVAKVSGNGSRSQLLQALANDGAWGARHAPEWHPPDPTPTWQAHDCRD